MMMVKALIETHLQFNSHGLVILATSFINLAVGLVILANNPKSKVHQSFFAIALTTFLWLISYGMILLSKSLASFYLWARLEYITTPLISPAVYLFSCLWTHSYPTQSKIVKGAFAFSGVLIILGLMFIEDIFYPHNYWWGRALQVQNNSIGPVYHALIMVSITLFALLSFINFTRAYLAETAPLKRVQLRNFIIAFLIAYTGATDLLVIRGLNVYTFGFVSITIFNLVVSYNVIRHDFLSINIWVRRISAIVLIYSCLLALAVPFNFWFWTRLSESSAQLTPPIALSLSLLFGVVLSMGPVIYAAMVRHSYWLNEKVTTGLAHELKSPLGAIHGAVEILKREVETRGIDNQKIDEYLQLIQNNAGRLENYAADLLTIANVQEGSIQVSKSPVNLTDLLEDLVSASKATIENKNITITIIQDMPARVSGDRDKIQQVVSNILTNAVKYSHQGNIAIAVCHMNGDVQVSIKDQGCGILKEDLPKVFNRFYQGKNASKGSGIGLAIAKAWVEAHGGRIWAESEGEGKGTKVTFTLPTA